MSTWYKVDEDAVIPEPVKMERVYPTCVMIRQGGKLVSSPNSARYFSNRKDAADFVVAREKQIVVALMNMVACSRMRADSVLKWLGTNGGKTAKKHLPRRNTAW